MVYFPFSSSRTKSTCKSPDIGIVGSLEQNSDKSDIDFNMFNLPPEAVMPFKEGRASVPLSIDCLILNAASPGRSLINSARFSHLIE